MATDRIGDYRVESRLSVGGMSEVFLARAPSGERVVVKVLLPQHQALPEAQTAFEHEAGLGEKLTHPNIVKTKGYGRSELGPYLALEWVDGADVAQLLASKERFSTEEVLATALDSLSALQHIHTAKDENGKPLHIVHRDISPDNIVVNRAGEGKLLDFGIARSALRETRTRTGLVRGKVRYLSPEQATGSEVDVRSDLYSLAAVLYEMATGEPHLRGDSDLELLRRAEDPVFEKPSQHGANACLDAFLERALSRFAEDRYPSAKAMERGARECLQTLGENALARARTSLAERVGKAAKKVDVAVAPPEGDGRGGGALSDRGTVKLTVDQVTEGAVRPASTRRKGAWALAALLVLGAGALWMAKRGLNQSREAGLSTADIAAGVPTTGELAGPGLPTAPTPLLAADPSGNLGSPASTMPMSSVGFSATPVVPATATSRPVSPASVPIATGSASGTTSSPIAPPSSSVTNLPIVSSVPSASVTAVSTLPKVAPKEAAAAKMAAVSAQLKAAKSKGHDVSQLEARAALALQAYLDGRYDDTERALDKIAYEIPR
ncbi:MAG: serine/threonine protein kinase [Polyangiaceae bacterium]|nr:serine/threonine protein kinase [Polyangiaceae bacterium]